MIPKFRCFDKDTNTMHEVVSIDFRDWRVYYEAYGLRNYWNKNVVLMQSTGLHDKNGVEIFEYSELDGAYEVIFKDLIYSLRHIQNNDIIDLYDYWRGKNGEIEVTREYTKV